MSNISKTKNVLARKFTFWSLIKFTLPTIVMMVFMSMYTMVDGVFVSNFIGENALSAVNMVYPLVSVVVAIAIMLATGGSAVIARKMGANKKDEAKQNFTLIVIFGIIVGFILMLIGVIFIEPIIKLLGATAALHDYCRDYLMIMMLFAPFAILQMLFQYFFVTAGKPNLGLIATIAGGVVNVVLDYLFIGPFNMGIAGAAISTGIGYSIPAIFGLLYFAFSKNGTLHFVKPKFDGKMLLESSSNGASEMVTNLSTAVTTLLFNLIMIKYLGEDGVAAITIVLYAQFLLTAIYIGFSSGVAPIISYNYGESNVTELKKIFKTSMIFITISAICVFVLSIILSPVIVRIFVKPSSSVFALATHGFLLFSFSYLFTGYNIFSSAMFTAFSNGKVSAIISFLRTFVFIIAGVLLLPMLIGANGIWLAVPIAEVLTVIVSVLYFVRLKDVYHYA